MRGWVGIVHLISPAATFWPEEEHISGKDFEWRPKLMNRQELHGASTLSPLDGQQDVFSEQAMPQLVVKEASMELVEEQHETRVNATTHRSGDIFDYKDIWEGLELSHNSSQKGGDSKQPMNSGRGSNISDMSSVSTGIYASSMSSYSVGSDTDEPQTDSSGIDAPFVTNSSLGSEALEILPSSTEDQRHDLLRG